MANRYVRSTDGNDADDGSTWALADASLTGASATDAAGDVIWVSDVHAESTASAITFPWAGTAASPTRVICGDDVAEPPTALTTTATVETTGNSNINIVSTGHCYIYGITFNAGVGASGTAQLFGVNSAAGSCVFDSCNFNLATTGTSSVIALANAFQSLATAINCGFQFSATAQSINCTGTIVIRGGSILSDAAVTTLWTSLNNDAKITMIGMDLSNGAAAMNLSNSTTGGVILKAINCKLPASWSGSVNSATPGTGSVFELYNSDATDTNYRYQRKTSFGIIDSDTTIVRTGGATDGFTALSWKMASNADTEWNHQSLDTGEIVSWNETTGSAITVTIEVTHDSVTALTDQQLWLDVLYLGTSGFPLGSYINDSSGNYLSTPANQASSGATWSDGSFTNANRQKLSVTFTPQEKGFIHATVKLAMASKTVYIDPKVTVS